MARDDQTAAEAIYEADPDDFFGAPLDERLTGFFIEGEYRKLDRQEPRSFKRGDKDLVRTPGQVVMIAGDRTYTVDYWELKDAIAALRAAGIVSRRDRGNVIRLQVSPRASGDRLYLSGIAPVAA